MVTNSSQAEARANSLLKAWRRSERGSLSFNELFALAKSQNPALYHPQIARTLRWLKEKNLVKEIATKSSRKRYVITADLETLKVLKWLEQGVMGIPALEQNLKETPLSKRRIMLATALFRISNTLAASVVLRVFLRKKWKGQFDDIFWSSIERLTLLMKNARDLDEDSTNWAYVVVLRMTGLLSDPERFAEFANWMESKIATESERQVGGKP